MSVRHSLRLRFALTFALVGAVLVLIHAVAILQLNRHQEAQLIDQIVSDEMEGLLQQYERIGSIDGPPYRSLQRFDVRADTQALSLRKWFRASWLVHGYATRGLEEQRQLPAELRELEVDCVSARRYLLMVETGDEVLDYRDAVEKYRGSEQVVIDGGDHGFSDFERYMDRALAFCGFE